MWAISQNVDIAYVALMFRKFDLATKRNEMIDDASASAVENTPRAVNHHTQMEQWTRIMIDIRYN